MRLPQPRAGTAAEEGGGRRGREEEEEEEGRGMKVINNTGVNARKVSLLPYSLLPVAELAHSSRYF